MRFSLAFLLALVGLALAGDWVSPYRTDSIEVLVYPDSSALANQGREPHWPIALSGASPQIVAITNGAANGLVAGHVHITAEGGPLFARVAGRFGPIALGPTARYCKSVSGSVRWECKLPFRLTDQGPVELKAADADAVLHAVVPVIVKADGVAPTGVVNLFALFALLSVLGLAFMALHSNTIVRLNVLAAVGAGWLLTSAGLGGAAILLLLFAIFWLLRLQLLNVSASHRLAATVFVAVGALLAVRTWLATGMTSFANPGNLEFGVPLGFAFLAIRTIDLALRISTREIRELKFQDYARYMLFPATLAAGPIMTLPQFRMAGQDTVTLTHWTDGLSRIATGVAKKLLADLLLARVSGPSTLSLMSATDTMPAAELWALLAATAVYVYLDFSGYSDIAIGLGRQLGFRVPENFANPFSKSTMRTFWQAWHITLSTWVARWVHVFVAFPLRDSHRIAQLSLPVLISLMTIGLWHELQLTWLFWGMHHAIGILIGDATGRVFKSFDRQFGYLRRSLTRLAGMSWVWGWVALSHTFTLISDPAIAARTWLRAATFGLIE